MLWICAGFYLPGQGFTYLVMFGDKESPRFIPELRTINHYELPNSYGYDGAYYAQLAMQPNLSDPALKKAVDNPIYRARRMLLSWTAWGLALGDPQRALHIFSVQNLACWILLAALLLRWFPAVSWGNFLRWGAVLFCYGLCFSLRGSLTDGPSLLLIACGVALAERGRPWWSAAVLGISGLAKETNILGGAALAQPSEPGLRGWGKVALRGALVLLPILLWLLVLRRWLGPSNDLGINNFTWPLASYLEKWRDTLAAWRVDELNPFARLSVMMLVSLTVQFWFFALYRRWENPWWRVAAGFAVMMVFLGQAVWEGYPGAASRVLLPMTLAFNILVPRGRRWWIVLLLGNLTVLGAPEMLQAAPRDSFKVEGEHSLRHTAAGRPVEVIFGHEWFQPERTRLEYWRWSSGPTTITLRNPHPYPIMVTVSFGIRARDARTVGLWQANYARWERKLAAGELREVKVRNMRLEPGDTLWRFETDRPGDQPNTGDPRALTFCLRNLTLTILGKADPVPPPR